MPTQFSAKSTTQQSRSIDLNSSLSNWRKTKKKKKREQKLPFFSIENVFPAQFVLLKLSIDLSVGGLVDPCKREIYRCYGVLLVAHASRCLQPSFGFLADLVCVIEGYALVEYLQ